MIETNETLSRYNPYIAGAHLYLLYEYATDFKNKVKDKAIWDFKYSVDFRQIFLRDQTHYGSPTEVCGERPPCKRTVTLCGKCVDYDVPGNIHYGYIGRISGLPRVILLKQASKVQKGGADPDHDVAAIEIGMDLADNGGNFCALVNARAGKLNYGKNDKAKKCHPCPVGLKKNPFYEDSYNKYFEKWED